MPAQTRWFSPPGAAIAFFQKWVERLVVIISRPDQAVRHDGEHELGTVTPAAIKWLFSSRKTAEDTCNLLKLADYVDCQLLTALETENLDILWPEDCKARSPSFHSVESEDSQKTMVAHSDSQSAQSPPLPDVDDADTESQTSLSKQEDRQDHQLLFLEEAFSEEDDGIYELPDGVRKEVELAIPKLIARWLAGIPELSALFLDYAPALVYRLVLDRMTSVPGQYHGNLKNLLVEGLGLDEYSTARESYSFGRSVATSPISSIQRTPQGTLGEEINASPPREGSSNWFDRTPLGRRSEESHLSDLSANFYDHATVNTADIGIPDPEQDLRFFAQRALRPRRRSESSERTAPDSEGSEEEGASVIIKGDGSVLTPTAYLCRAFGLPSLNESL
jgi:hypothetical protein